MSVQNTPLSVWVVAVVVAASMIGCIHVNQHERYEVVMDVRSRGTGEPLANWVVKSVLVSNEGWTTHNARRTITETLLLVQAQDPRHNTYQVEPFTSGGIILIPPLGYGGWKMECCTVYAIGYEPGQRIASQEVLQKPTDAGDGPGMEVKKFTYFLEPRNNRPGSLALEDFLTQLKDPGNFRAYEAIRGTAKGTGVPDLYRYYVARFEAICEANPTMPIDPAVEETVAWLKRAATGAPVREAPARATVTHDEMPGMSRERVVRVVPTDAETGKVLEEWVLEVVLLALTESKPEGEFHQVLSVDWRTSDAPESRVPAFKHTHRGPEGIIRFLDCEVVYVIGYEPSLRPAEEKLTREGQVLRYRLERWNNSDAERIREFAQLLESDTRFNQYEELRKNGSLSVPALYRYLLARYEALGQAQQERLSPKARERIDWIRNRMQD